MIYSMRYTLQHTIQTIRSNYYKACVQVADHHQRVKPLVRQVNSVLRTCDHHYHSAFIIGVVVVGYLILAMSSKTKSSCYKI